MLTSYFHVIKTEVRDDDEVNPPVSILTIEESKFPLSVWEEASLENINFSGNDNVIYGLVPDSRSNNINIELSVQTDLDSTSLELENKAITKENLTEKRPKKTYKELLRSCETCGKMVEHAKLQGHINKEHLFLTPFKCNIEDCVKSFHCCHSLKYHKRSVHFPIDLLCNICGKIYHLRVSFVNMEYLHKILYF